MRNRHFAGTSLVEILVVIVVFLVGILALVQIFPGGLGTLRTTRDNAIAENLARAELERIKARADEMPENIHPVKAIYAGPNSVVFEIDQKRQMHQLLPGDTDPAINSIDANGDMLDSGGNKLGYWPLFSGANLFNRVMGEGGKIPTPRFVNQDWALYGSLVNVMFAPIRYERDPVTFVAKDMGSLVVYGNDMIRKRITEGVPFDPAQAGYESEFYFQNGAPGQLDFPNQDKLWIYGQRPNGAGVPVFVDLRFRLVLNFTYAGLTSQAEQVELVLVFNLPASALPLYARQNGGYYVVSLPKLIENLAGYSEPDYRETISLAMQRVFRERPFKWDHPEHGFDPTDPYEYWVINDVQPNASFGSVMINSVAAGYELPLPGGGKTPLMARFDYTVFDWGIMRDEFRIPATGPWEQKLVLGSLKVKNEIGADRKQVTGIGVKGPSSSDLEIEGVYDQDVIIQDLETGGIIVGDHRIGGRNDSFRVDKSNGIVKFYQPPAVAGGPPRIAIRYAQSHDDLDYRWSSPASIDDPRGRAVRVYYKAKGEWAMHVTKAAQKYRVKDFVDISFELQAGECFVGGTYGLGDTNKLYFPLSDVGRKVVIGEVWYRDTTAGRALKVRRDQAYMIDGAENIGSMRLGVINMPREIVDFREFDFATNGYAVRGVKGASVSVRVLRNATSFSLDEDPAEFQNNYNAFERWMASTRRRVETESFIVGGSDR